MRRLPRVVVLGLLGRIPFAGVAWQVLHYLEGFRRLGCEVYYVEDTGAWTHDDRRTIEYIARLMDWCGAPDRWAYRSLAEDGRVFGLLESEVSRVFERADALVSLCSPTLLRDEHLRVPVRIYLETDPVSPQIQLARNDPFVKELLSAHTHHFTYAENLGAPDCGVPIGQFNYHPTRQPVVLDWWEPAAVLQNGSRRTAAARYTTITSWKQSGRDVEWNGEIYGWSKHSEFLKVIELPRRTQQPLELALACDDAEAIRLLNSHGWRIVDAIPLSNDIVPYREYILGSCGEFTVAKDQYARLRSGWFSDRSACYLAAGKPVVTQDTGFGNVLPTGQGLFAFQTMNQAADALERVNADYNGHANAAREIAREYFAAEGVLASMLERVGL